MFAYVNNFKVNLMFNEHRILKLISTLADQNSRVSLITLTLLVLIAKDREIKRSLNVRVLQKEFTSEVSFCIQKNPQTVVKV